MERKREGSWIPVTEKLPEFCEFDKFAIQMQKGFVMRYVRKSMI